MDNIDWNALISGLIGTAVLAIPQFYMLRNVARKTRADASNGEASAVKTFAEGADLTGRRNIDLQNEINRLEERIAQLEGYVEILKEQVKELGGIPPKDC